MIYITNILLAVFLAYFTLEVFPEIPGSGLVVLFVFICSYTLLWIFSSFYSKTHFRKVPMIVALFIYYLKELLKASIQVTYDVLTPTPHMKPGIIAFKMKARTPIEITLLANFITLTPGSLSIDISDDERTLYIHETYIKGGDIERYKEKLRNGFEKRILKVTR